MDKPVTTSWLLMKIRRSGSFLEAVDWHKDHETPAFHQELYEQMVRHDMDAKELIQKTKIERSYFYHILSGKKIPRRTMTLRICTAMRLTLKETNHLLQLSGASALYAKNRHDAIIIYGIEKKLGLMEINALLLEAHEDPLLI